MIVSRSRMSVNHPFASLVHAGPGHVPRAAKNGLLKDRPAQESPADRARPNRTNMA